jgi:hypothetical protein
MMIIKVGDRVNWRGGFGADTPKIATITGMDITEQPREKYGESVEEVDIDLIRQNRVLFSLDNGHWAYSDQIEV